MEADERAYLGYSVSRRRGKRHRKPKYSKSLAKLNCSEIPMIQVLIQVEAGSRERRLYNEKTLEYRETRRMPQPFPYPYGFVIGTSAEDGDAVDCYIITKDKLKAGSIVECEPVGLLEQHEGDEIDHKILASLPGQDVKLGNELLQELQEFILAIFAHFQEVQVRVGPILPLEAALQHIRACQDVSDA